MNPLSLNDELVETISSSKLIGTTGLVRARFDASLLAGSNQLGLRMHSASADVQQQLVVAAQESARYLQVYLAVGLRRQAAEPAVVPRLAAAAADGHRRGAAVGFLQAS